MLVSAVIIHSDSRVMFCVFVMSFLASTSVAPMLLSAGMSLESTGSDGRAKRIIGGKTFNGRPPNYELLKYTGAMATLHLNAWIGRPFRGAWYWAGTVQCMGALTSPKIFLTACHCVAWFNGRGDDFPALPNDHYFWFYFTDRQAWGYNQYVYMGLSERWGNYETDGPLPPYTFLRSEEIDLKDIKVHQSCAKVKNHVIYDFAILKLDRWTDLLRNEFQLNWAEMNWAPLYSEQQLLDNIQNAQARQSVCLYLGFGEENPGGGDSASLRHSWVVLKSDHQCWRYSISNGMKPSWISWVCADNFPQNDAQPSDEPIGADDGAPLACGNDYIAHLSSTFKNPRGIIKFHSLDHFMDVSVAEYRKFILNSPVYT